MRKAELIFIPSPGAGHLASTVELAKLLVGRDEGLSITVLIMKLPLETSDHKSSTDLFSGVSISRLQFIELPRVEFSEDDKPTPTTFLPRFIELQKQPVREAVERIATSGVARISGVVIDMFCASMIDVANEFGIPSYVFFTSGAAILSLTFHFQSLRDNFNQDVNELMDPDGQLSIPGYVNPVPVQALPSVALDKSGGLDIFLNLARSFRETKGIMVNTFQELESHALKSLSEGENIPPVYSVGPILNLNANMGHKQEQKLIIKWLDDQPTSSVVYLCFGSMGSFHAEQVKEIACALERSGHRFLWSLRRPPTQDKPPVPTEYENLEDALPEGFLQRTSSVGKVIGWSPQMAVLSHPAVGGFVSHCGWNSTLESVWNAVPIATWPLYAEQQTNAFQLIKELEMAVEIKMDYRIKDFWKQCPTIVTAEEIENGIKKLMNLEKGMKKKVELMKKNSRMALEEGGSSYTSIGTLIERFMVNA